MFVAPLYIKKNLFNFFSILINGFPRPLYNSTNNLNIDFLFTFTSLQEERKTETKVNQGKMDDIVKIIMSMPISPVELLKVFTCMLAGIYTGCSVYAAVIEAPSRSNLPLHSLWEQWSTSLTRAAKVIVSHILANL